MASSVHKTPTEKAAPAKSDDKLAKPAIARKTVKKPTDQSGT